MLPSNSCCTGVLSQETLKVLPGVPGQERLEAGPVACLECAQEIPCNPCETGCPRGAIAIGEQITALPRLDQDRCNGCGACVSCCPGLAIFTVHKNHTDHTALVSFPFEYAPLPRKGDRAACTGRDGGVVTRGTVHRVVQTKGADKTAVVTVEVPKEYCMQVRGMEWRETNG